MAGFTRSARFRLILLVLLATIPALALAVFAGLDYRRQSADKARSEASVTARLASDSFSNLLSSAEQQVISLAQLPDIKNRQAADCITYLVNLQKKFSMYDTLAAAVPDGSVFCSSRPASGVTSLADRSYFQQVVSTHQMAVSGFLIDRFSGKSSVVLAYPSLDDRGSLQAVAIVSLDLDTMAQVAAAAQLPPDSVFVMIDGQGNVLLRNSDALQTQGKLYSNAAVRQAVLGATQPGAIEAPGIDGIRRLYAYLPLSSTPAGSGYMIVGYPTSWVYGDADRLLERNLIGLVLVGLLALAAAWVLGDALLLRQVRALVATARRWTSGDLAARAGLEKGSTEILDLAAAYDEMADAVQQREDRLVQAEARYRNLVEQIPVVTYTAPPEHPLAFAYISPQVQDLLDLAPQVLVDGRASFLNLVADEDRRRVQQAVEGLRTGADEISLEYRLCPGGDRIVWVQHQARLLCDETGRPLLVQGLMQDISARKEAEQALTLRTLQLAHTNRELQDFVYIASHDLQEPLRKIQAFGERLRSMYQAQLAGKGSDYIDRMTGAAARMQTMINDLLAYSRVTTRSQPPAPVDLNQVLQEVISDLEVSIERNRGRVEVSPLPPVLADPLQMHGLLQNLIGNALKFHRPGVDPVVRVSALPGGGEDSDGQDFVRIVVADNGIGFDEKYVDRIFQPFQRLHARTEFEGSGIGLAICRKIAEQYGGKITASSTLGQGAVFEVTLRACPADPGENE